MLEINEMTKKDFKSLRSREWSEDIGLFDGVVIIPESSKQLHDSGYRCIDFIAVKKQIALCKMSGCSDALHLNGIGGRGKFNDIISMSMPVLSWNMDCLAKSGYIHLWCSGYELTADPALSSFSIYVHKIKESK